MLFAVWMSKLVQIYNGCDEIWSMGGGTKESAKEEQVTIDFAFASVCSIKAIVKGGIY